MLESDHNETSKSDDGDILTPEEIDEILKQLEKGIERSGISK